MATYKSDGLRISTYTNGDTAIVAYCTAGSFITNSNTITPGKPTVNKPDAASLSAPWSYEEPEPNEGKGYGTDGLPYIFKCEGLKKTSGGTITYTWLEPTLYKAWNNMGIDVTEYAQFVEQTYYFTSDALAWIKPDGEEAAKLYIKASEILVNDTNQQKLFEAGGNKVCIAGWDITPINIFKETTMENKDYSIIINSNTYTAENAIPYNPVFGIYNRTDNKWPFLVRSDGTLEATKADITGKIFAEDGGKIGGWLIDSGNIVSKMDKHSIILKPDSIEDIGISEAIEIGLGTFEAFFTRNYDFFEKDINYVKSNCAMRVAFTSGAFGSEVYNPGIEAYTQDGTDQFFTVGVRSYSGYYNSHIEFSNRGTLKLSAFDNMMYGKIYFNGIEYTSASISDARKKHSIERLSEQYETLFNKLRPTRYKYIDGTSNRYHTGFIAQEVVSSLEESGLSTLDFAAVVLQEPGTENEVWQLRRDEFVALNTWQIQKLKPRMTAAEEKIAQLELEISSLKSELENLKKS